VGTARPSGATRDNLRAAARTDEVLIPPMKGLTECALLVVLALTAGSQQVFAQRLACSTIQSGETAAQVAVRITGHARNRHEPWFQIMDPAASRFIAKAQYDRIRPGWHACIVNEPVTSDHRRGNTRTAAAARVRAASSDIARTLLAGIQTDPVWSVVIVLVMPAFAWYVADRYWKDRQAVIDIMARFGEAFIREFERPLTQSRSPEPAIRSRLRFRPYQGRLEVFLAPSAGRSYPNLSDHRQNVEYDMGRVLQVLGNQAFVSGHLHQQGQWVVVPFRVQVREQQEGVT
jgi:hypothetical protein